MVKKLKKVKTKEKDEDEDEDEDEDKKTRIGAIIITNLRNSFHRYEEMDLLRDPDLARILVYGRKNRFIRNNPALITNPLP